MMRDAGRLQYVAVGHEGSKQEAGCLRKRGGHVAGSAWALHGGGGGGGGGAPAKPARIFPSGPIRRTFLTLLCGDTRATEITIDGEWRVWRCGWRRAGLP